MDLLDVKFRFASDVSEQEEIARNLRFLLLTPAGTCPLDREFGLDQSLFIDMPMNVAQNTLAVEIMDKVDRYEPRVSVREVTYTATETGQIIPSVVIVSA